MNRIPFRLLMLAALLLGGPQATVHAQSADKGGAKGPAKPAAKDSAKESAKSSDKGSDKSADKGSDKGGDKGGSSSAKKPDDPSKPDSDTSSTTNSMAEQMKAIFGSGFQKLVCENFEMPPEGEIVITGSVTLKTDQMTLVCNRLTMNQETKIMVAVGTPVKVTQEGVYAECGLFTYDTDKKISKLDQSPYVVQKDGEKSTRMDADHITLTQGANGKTGINLHRDAQNPNKVTTIEVKDPGTKKPADTGARGEGAQKVTGDKGISKINLVPQSSN